MKKMFRIFNGIKNVDSFVEGVYNFENGINNDLAKNRFEQGCKDCPEFQEEPIKSLQIKDITIPELSEKYCNDCGCVLSYKLRIITEKCSLKLW